MIKFLADHPAAFYACILLILVVLCTIWAKCFELMPSQRRAPRRKIPKCSQCDRALGSYPWPGRNGDICDVCWNQLCTEDWKQMRQENRKRQ